MSDAQQMGLMLAVTAVTLAVGLLHYWLVGSYQSSAMALPVAMWQGVMAGVPIMKAHSAGDLVERNRLLRRMGWVVGLFLLLYLGVPLAFRLYYGFA